MNSDIEKLEMDRINSKYSGNFFCATDEMLAKVARQVDRINKNPNAMCQLSYKVYDEFVRMEDGTYEQIFVVLFDEFPENYFVNDWEFVGYIEDNVIYTYPHASVHIPNQLIDMIKNVGNICTHCNKKRLRKRSYFLYNSVDPEWQIVGSSCIKDFLGSDPTKLLRDIDNLFTEYESEFHQRIRKPYYYPLQPYLIDVFMQIKYGGEGYKSVSKYGYSESTVCAVDYVFFHQNKEEREKRKKMLWGNDYEKHLPEAEQYVEKMMAEFESVLIEKIQQNVRNNKDTTFLQNELEIFSANMFTLKQAGFVCYMPVLFGIDLQEKKSDVDQRLIVNFEFHTLEKLIPLFFEIDQSELNFKQIDSDFGSSILVKGWILEYDVNRSELLYYPASMFISFGMKQFQKIMDVLESSVQVRMRAKVYTNKYGHNLKLVRDVEQIIAKND